MEKVLIALLAVNLVVSGVILIAVTALVIVLKENNRETL